MAIVLSGTNDYIYINDNALIRPSNLTISVWFNAKVISSAALVSKAWSGPPWSFPYVTWLLRINNATQIEADLGTPGAYSASVWSVSAISPGYWYHICMTYDGYNIKLYLNSYFIGPAKSWTSGIGYTTRPILIGADHSSAPASEYFNGTISDVKIYNRALSDNEISGIYNSKLKFYSNSEGLILYLPLDEEEIGKISPSSWISSDTNQLTTYRSGSVIGAGESLLTYKQGLLI